LRTACSTVQMVAKRPASTVSVRSRICAAVSVWPEGVVMSKVSVASVT
jgi:hypothetical protein